MKIKHNVHLRNKKLGKLNLETGNFELENLNLEIGVNSVILYFNDGSQTQTKVIKRDKSEMREAVCKSSEKDKKSRKQFTSTKIGYSGKEKKKRLSLTWLVHITGFIR